MMRIIKRIGIGFALTLIIIIVLITIVSTVRWQRDYEDLIVVADDIPIPTGDAAIAQGEHIATTRFCGFCHGEDLSGGYLMNEPAIAVVPAPNLTSGKGGVGASNSDEDWVRAIRHGVGHDNRGLLGMPSRIWYQLSDEDLGVLIAYLKTVPAVENEFPDRRIGPLLRVMLALGQAPTSEGMIIDHDAPRSPMPERAVTAEYGQYLVATSCTACHGTDLAGGTIRDLKGELIVALNLTPGGELKGWSEADFINTIRTGVTVDGRTLNEVMPWRYIGQMTDEELQAIWLYLQSIPPLEQNLERSDL